MQFYLIGIGNKKASLPPNLQALVQQQRMFSGGQRHYELVKHLLPENHCWISIQNPLQEVFKAYEEAGETIIVFASGNPLFYGFGNTLRNRYPDAAIQSYPSFSSIQLLADKAGLNSNELRTVSVHGRSWQALDEAIIRQEPLLGVLTDAEKSPSAIASRLLHYGYTNYKMLLGEELEGAQERIRYLSLEEALGADFSSLNCLILQRKNQRDIPFGIPDSQMEGLEGRPKMITKMPIRLYSLHALELQNKTVLWDIGFCTGSVSIEAKLRFPQLAVHGFEVRPECLQLLEANQRRWGAPGIQAHMGDIFEQNLQKVPPPDAVFVGGHGGRLPELLQKIDEYLFPGGVIVMNAVQESSRQDFEETAKMLGWKMGEIVSLTVDSHNPITVLQAVKIK